MVFSCSCSFRFTCFPRFFPAPFAVGTERWIALGLLYRSTRFTTFRHFSFLPFDMDVPIAKRATRLETKKPHRLRFVLDLTETGRSPSELPPELPPDIKLMLVCRIFRTRALWRRFRFAEHIAE